MSTATTTRPQHEDRAGPSCHAVAEAPVACQKPEAHDREQVEHPLDEHRAEGLAESETPVLMRSR